MSKTAVLYIGATEQVAARKGAVRLKGKAMAVVEQIKHWWDQGLLAFVPICITILISVVPFALNQAQLEQSMQDQLKRHDEKLVDIQKQTESLSSQIQSLQEQLTRIENHQLHRTAPHKVVGGLSEGFSGPTPQQ